MVCSIIMYKTLKERRLNWKSNGMFSMRAHVVWVLTRESKVYSLKFFYALQKIKNVCHVPCNVVLDNTHIYHGMMILAHTI